MTFRASNTLYSKLKPVFIVLKTQETTITPKDSPDNISSGRDRYKCLDINSVEQNYFLRENLNLNPRDGFSSNLHDCRKIDNTLL